ncbi:MAG TPA: DUF1080 domain-containing protein [Planctomycetes bacterium]|nr:DUF1080 domain-containing protein [Planctomycetota bacterium]
MTISLAHFRENLVRSGLLSAAELDAFEASLPPEQRPRDAQTLARRLIRAGKLTRYQAAAVYRGRTRGLALGEYVVLDEIGRGGMGQVFKARHRTMERVVALKVLPSQAVSSPQAVKRFQREVRAAARLIHPNIVTAFDAGEHEGVHYLVMEYVEGQDLGRLVAERGPLGVEEALDYVIQAARGLEYAHRQGVVHRDIKPGNLLVDRRGRVMVLDMGLARLGVGEGPSEESALTGTGQLMGTCDYMAPEQAEDTHHVDARADIYSLGCTLYRLLTGRSPYQGKTLVQVLVAHREAPIPSLREVRPDVPERLQSVFRKMLAKDPEQRYQSMGELIEALESCRAGRPVARAAVQEPVGDQALSSFLRALAGESGGRVRPAARKETIPTRPGGETAGGRFGRLLGVGRGRKAPYAAAAVAAVGAVVALALVVFWPRAPGGAGRPATASEAMAEVIIPWPAAQRNDARLQIDGASVEVDASVDRIDPDQLKLALAPGQHRIRIARRGYETFERGFSLAPGERLVLELQWRKSATEPPLAPGAAAQSGPPGRSAGGVAVTYPARIGPLEFLGPPENLGPVVNSGDDDVSPSLSADKRILMFASNRPGGQGGMDLWMCRRPSSEASWQPPTNLGPTVNSGAADNAPFLSADGLLLVFDSERAGGHGDRDIWMCKRESLDQSWATPVNLGSSVNTQWQDSEPTVSRDGLSLWFQSTRPGGVGLLDLWMCRRTSRGGRWEPATNLGPGVNTGSYETAPALSSDGLVLLFGAPGAGGDLWMSTRPARHAPWGKPVSLGAFVNTSYEEWCPCLSPDGTTLLFQSDRPGGSGGFDLYQVPIRLYQQDGSVGAAGAADLAGAPSKPIHSERPDVATAGPWRSLCNGRDLTGWVVVGRRNAWRVKDGAIVAQAGMDESYLCTEQEFTDYVFRFEYRLPAGGNSGVFLRTARSQAAHKGQLEIQLLDDSAPQWRSLDHRRRTGALYGLAPAKARLANPAGRWHQVEISLRGGRLVVHIDGVRMLDVELDAYRNSGRNIPALERRSGGIGLQYWGTGVEFRNLHILPLSPGLPGPEEARRRQHEWAEPLQVSVEFVNPPA